MRKKFEVFENFQEYKKEVDKLLWRDIKMFRSDWSGEYISNLFGDFFKDNGIIHQTTMSYTPQQNGVAECHNRTLLDMVRSMLNHFSLGWEFWGEAIVIAMYLLNLVPTKIIDKTPHELWTGRKPILDN